MSRRTLVLLLLVKLASNSCDIDSKWQRDVQNIPRLHEFDAFYKAIEFRTSPFSDNKMKSFDSNVETGETLQVSEILTSYVAEIPETDQLLSLEIFTNRAPLSPLS